MQQGQYPTWVSTWLMLRVCGFLYLEIEVMCVEFGCHIEVELEYEFHMVHDEELGFGIGEVVLSTFKELQMLGFFLQMGFTLILATLDGLDVGLLGDVIGEDDCDEDE
ncbi:hypothetical protein Tco_0149303 [Tanacetum coccineum]